MVCWAQTFTNHCLSIQIYKAITNSGFSQFLLKFVGILLGWIILDLVFSEYIQGPIGWLTWIQSYAASGILDGLHLLSTKVVYPYQNQESLIVLMPQHSPLVKVGFGCNALSLSLLFVAFMLLFPGKLQSKLFYLLLGIISIHILNIIRIGALTLMAKEYPEIAELNHKYIFTAIMYLFIAGLWYFWLAKNLSSSTK